MGFPLCLLASLVLLCLGGKLIVTHAASDRAYHALAQEVSETSDPRKDSRTTDGEDQLDWTRLTATNPDTVAWVCVRGTDIDLPVVAPADGDMDHYLTHDFWGRQSRDGTPFLDHRCQADGTHRIVYGHHLTLGGQFSALQHMWEQDCFSTLGACVWSTPSRGAVTFLPFCAIKTTMWDTDIQRFSFGEEATQLPAWLTELAAQASARSARLDELCAHAVSVVTLVTCSSDFSQQPDRTLVIFVEEKEMP